VNTTGTGSIPISGFKAILAGQVNMKLGIIASEGDVSFTGDFRCNKKIPLPIDLSHPGNITTNFLIHLFIILEFQEIPI
jgi:hypothetical protein